MEFTPGTLVAGKYRVGHLLGSGGAGEVWEAENIAIGARVALKKLRHASSHDATVRFRREAVILARIRSDHVARVLDFCEDAAFGYVLVLDLIEGESLSETLKLKRLGVEEAIGLGADLLAGLADLHRARIVHRDLKPSNIIEQVFDDGTRRAVIVDFGVSRLLADDSASADDDDAVTDITRGAMTIGTITYMAPEQLVNSSKVSYQADLYAVGTLLFRSVAGELPFAGMSQAALASIKRLDEAPRLVTGRTDPRAVAFERIVGRALKRRPEDRFPTAEAMLGELRTLKNEPGESAIVRAPIQDFDSEASLVTEPMLELTAAQMAALAESARRPPSTDDAEAAGAIPQETPAVAPSAWTPPPAPAPEPIAASPSRSPSSRAWLFAMVGGTTVGALIAGVIIGRASGSHPTADAPAVETASAAAIASSAAPQPSASASAEPASDDDEAPAASSSAIAAAAELPDPPAISTATTSPSIAPLAHSAAPRLPAPRPSAVAVNAAVSAAPAPKASAVAPSPSAPPAAATTSSSPPPAPMPPLKREAEP